MSVRRDRGFAISPISPQNGQGNAQTGRLGRNTLLHKRYIILRVIGQGGMGAVYQARDTKRGEICAVKEMSLSSVPPSEQGKALENFLAEATILSRLSHPNLPAFTDFFSEGERHFLVMEYIDGKTLEELLEENGGPFSERRVLGWARQLCDVLEYLHSQQPPVIFRDLKPGNIMLRRDGRIKLIDFGIARLVRRSSSQDTQLLGTPGFAPPEQYGSAQTDQRSDIYSLAVTLFQLLTGALPEKGFGLPDARTLNPAVSSTVARALEKAASLDPNDRYPSVAVFRRALFRVGTLPFENGQEATTPEELAELCARFPEEGADYLFNGEIESWLEEIGESDLARKVRRLRTTTGDPELGVERLVQLIMGPDAHLRTKSQGSVSATASAASEGARGRPPARPRKAPLMIVRPATINFGQVYPGLSAPMLLTITGNQGSVVQGTIQPVEPWIIVDQTRFDGMSTLVRVRVDSSQLAGSQRYNGTIVITPLGETAGKPAEVKVEVEVMDYTVTGPVSASGSRTASGQVSGSVGAGAGQRLLPPSQRSGSIAPALPAYINPQDEAYKAKYGQPGGWDLLRASPAERRRLHWLQVFAAALLAPSLFYELFSQLPFFSHAPLPPDPAFLPALLAMLPLAPLGALLLNTDHRWQLSALVNRFCTGLATTLAALGLLEPAWHSVFQDGAPALHALTLLALAALAGTLGSSQLISSRLLAGATWAMKRFRLPTLALLMVTGVSLGLSLALGTSLSLLTPLAVAAGAAVALALIFRIDRLIGHP
ncbi:MAG: serine/threonine protein kinase [Thermogemmatispora sp.]|uniref:serine/threonine-protein kinase n=1 Tax=Thermogemmatispora sp. TaxID=1968838 RepID=UPI002616C0C4|nr:serine/threonine-protein kinase [Thermogemmatispora sp.]MBX5456337.1 serine/threonine protein kinase [Thermogemmatispora sp.]